MYIGHGMLKSKLWVDYRSSSIVSMWISRMVLVKTFDNSPKLRSTLTNSGWALNENFFLVYEVNKLVLNPIPFSKQRKPNHGGVRREKVRLGKTFLLSFVSNWTLLFQKFQINLRGLRLLQIKPYKFFRFELNHGLRL